MDLIRRGRATTVCAERKTAGHSDREGLGRNETCQYLDPELLGSKTARKSISCCLSDPVYVTLLWQP